MQSQNLSQWFPVAGNYPDMHLGVFQTCSLLPFQDHSFIRTVTRREKIYCNMNNLNSSNTAGLFVYLSFLYYNLYVYFKTLSYLEIDENCKLRCILQAFSILNWTKSYEILMTVDCTPIQKINFGKCNYFKQCLLRVWRVQRLKKVLGVIVWFFIKEEVY